MHSQQLLNRQTQLPYPPEQQLLKLFPALRLMLLGALLLIST